MYRTWRQLPVLFSPMLHNEENADTDNYPTSLYVASARKSALCPHTGNGHLVTLNLMVTVMGRESCASLHRTGGFRRRGLGHRLCFVIKSACLCRDGPPGPHPSSKAPSRPSGRPRSVLLPFLYCGTSHSW